MQFKFGDERPNQANNFIATAFDNSVYRDFPVDEKKAPFRLDIKKVLGPHVSNTKMIFHTVGDTGGVKFPMAQQIVANKMEEQFSKTAKPEDQPLFMYHLGDVVYYYGEDSHYNSQFFDPYMHYPAPIFAIAGNHDGDIDPTNLNPPTTLAAFNKVFCSDAPVHLPIAGESSRTTMIQPNVYWTLQTPLANIIGLYCNDTKEGEIRKQQLDWFKKELLNAQLEQHQKAIIVTLHYPVFSVDNDHGSSGAMKALLDGAFAETKVTPDLVLSGHVHNYQRFTRTMNNGNELPYIVAGAGGYYNLHKVEKALNQVYVPNSGFFKDVVMEEFCDDRFGFLQITIEHTGTERSLIGEYFTVPRPQESWAAPAKFFDYFKIDLNKHKVINVKGK